MSWDPELSADLQKTLTLADQAYALSRGVWRLADRLAAVRPMPSGGPVGPSQPPVEGWLSVDAAGNAAPYPLPPAEWGRVHPSWVGPDGVEWEWLTPQGGGIGHEGWARLAKPGEGPGVPGG